MKNLNISLSGWRDYELIDSGDNRKLERYGSIMLIRPETQALWRPLRPELWQHSNAEFVWRNGKGAWHKRNGIPQSWQITWNQASVMLRLTSFKHTGIFPEQAANWEWIAHHIKRIRSDSQISSAPKILNLFGYTGIASIVAAQEGAQVTHVDASRQSNAWAKENEALSLAARQPSENNEGAIRYLCDDALKFVEREARRGAVYDGIILDPPAFGRGAKGEIWRIEEDMAKLLEILKAIFSKKPGSFFLLNGYAAGYSPYAFAQVMQNVFPETATVSEATFGELHIQESNSDRCIPAGIYSRFVR